MIVCTITGYLGKDADLKLVGDKDTPLLKFSVASSSYDFSKREKVTTWANCAWFGRRAEAMEKFLKKGQLVAVTAEMTESEGKTKDGEKRKYTNFSVINVELLGGKRDKDDDDDEDDDDDRGSRRSRDRDDRRGSRERRGARDEDRRSAKSSKDEDDDDIPF